MKEAERAEERADAGALRSDQGDQGLGAGQTDLLPPDPFPLRRAPSGLN